MSNPAFRVFGVLEQSLANFSPPEGKVWLKSPKSPNTQPTPFSSIRFPLTFSSRRDGQMPPK